MSPHTPNTLLESYLRQLKLPTFAQNYTAFAQDAARTDLSCERYLLALCEAELARRDTNRVERCITQARLPVLKELSQFDWSCVQGIAKTRVLELAQGGYITQAEPILMIGNPGLGKTHVATGLALAACRQGRRVRFYHVTTLVNDLVAAQHDLKLSRLLATLCRQDLLILDEFGFVPFSREGAHLLFQLCSALYERVAVIITSNLSFGDWKSVLGEEHLTAALLDRLTHRAHTIPTNVVSKMINERLRHPKRRHERTMPRKNMWYSRITRSMGAWSVSSNGKLPPPTSNVPLKTLRIQSSAI
jgi:DNA replication protein DnaC